MSTVNTTATQKLDIRNLPLDGPPVNDPLLARIARADAPPGYPLFDPSNFQLPPDPPALNRNKLADALAAGNDQLGNPLDSQTLTAIRTNARFIITGQQPCLLTGPSYVLLKAITVIQLARDLAARAKAPLIPAFWIATEDHDLPEVNHCTINGHTFTADHAQLRNPGPRPPVGSISLQPWRDDLLRFAQRMLLPSPTREEALTIIAESDFTNYSTMFGSLLAAILGPGRVVLIDPMRIREILSPALANIVEHDGQLEPAFDRGSKLLTDAGLEPQLDRLNLFQFVDGRRIHADLSASTAALIRKNPQQFSPGAALRPIVQDAALPVLCTIGGPAEMKYLWQIEPLYQVAAVNRSKLLPRLTATIVSNRDLQIAARFRLRDTAIFKVAQLLEQFDSNTAPPSDTDLTTIEQLRNQLIQRITKLNGQADPQTMQKAVRSINYQIDKLSRRVRERQLSQQGIGKDQLTQLANIIMPLGQPQERVTCGLELIGRFGLGLVHQLIRDLDPMTLAHRLIVIANDTKGEST